MNSNENVQCIKEEKIMEFKIEEPDKKIGQEIKANWDCVAKPLDGLGSLRDFLQGSGGNPWVARD